LRLSVQEIDLLKRELSLLSKDAKIYLFGSRVDDNKRGGDIDLLIVSKDINRKDIRKLRIEFFRKFGEQKIDIVLDDGSFSSTFVKLIYDKAVQL
jgi:predicted nucleotidyltransferase